MARSYVMLSIVFIVVAMLNAAAAFTMNGTLAILFGFAAVVNVVTAFLFGNAAVIRNRTDNLHN